MQDINEGKASIKRLMQEEAQLDSRLAEIQSNMQAQELKLANTQQEMDAAAEEHKKAINTLAARLTTMKAIEDPVIYNMTLYIYICT